MARTRGGLGVALAAATLAAGACTSVFGVDDGVSHEPRTVHEAAGSIGPVGLGSSEAEVRDVFGEPAGGDGFVPVGEAFRGPVLVRSPNRGRPVELRYEETAFLGTERTGVFALMTTNDGDVTTAGVAVGDPLARVRERYGRVRCGGAPAGEPIWRGEPTTYPWCSTRVGRVEVFFGDDPIEAITLVRAR